MFKVPIEKEFEFTTEKVNDNFSNYSAWHQRSKIIPEMFAENKSALQEALTNGIHYFNKKSAVFFCLPKELDLVANAFYVEPNDSSAWFYHQWLIEQSIGKFF
jgi:geranylgeranyl transferase type-2 subunit alpha